MARTLLDRLNVLNIGRCNWSTNFNLYGCRLRRGHKGPHQVDAATGLPPGLTTREAQEAWVRDHRPFQGKPDRPGA